VELVYLWGIHYDSKGVLAVLRQVGATVAGVEAAAVVAGVTEVSCEAFACFVGLHCCCL
jgi:hypothetical protein